ncbi:hypothetical protein [Nocardioides psychrotolerans]|nr:hypothetical protein [Nocardioides psychrotolerans]
MSAAMQPGWDDDLMAIADAAGVIASAHPDFDGLFLLDPLVAEGLTNMAIELGIRTWATTDPAVIEDTIYDLDTPIDLRPTGYLHEPTGMWVEDDQHHGCVGTDCDRLICVCPDALCAGHTERACPHYELLCDECRGECRDCVIDGQDDAGVLG